ncbi:MAG: nicotinamide-nucleotide adenylyltransferase [Desulfurococcaceae archaeon]
MADNMNTRRVLFPGRFQPFHLGHQAALEQLLSEFDEVIVAIGSSQEGFTCKNPFTAGERFEMIARFVVREGIRNRVWITTIPDINMPPAWSAYVLSMVPPVEAVASGNPQTLYLFEWLGFKVKKIRLVEPEKYHGTRIRDLSIYSKLQELLINPEASECEDKSYVKKALETLFYKRKPLWKQVTRLTYDLREASVLYGEIGMRVQELIKDKIRQEVSASLRSKNVEPQNIEVVFDKIDVYPTAGSEILDKIEIVDVKNGKLVYVESIDLNDFAEKAGLKPEALVTIYVDRDVYKRLESDDISKVIDVSKSIVESSIKGKRKEIPETS